MDVDDAAVGGEENLAGEMPERLMRKDEPRELLQATVSVVDDDTGDGEGFMAVKPWEGNVFAPTTWSKPANQDDLPDETLSVEWVFGYRGDDVRDNVFMRSNGELIYHIAGAGVVYDHAACKQRVFYGAHDDDIMCQAVSNDGKLVATGQIGRNPYTCVWNADTMQLVAKLKGVHQHGIVAVAFSDDGTHVATVGADPQHSLAVWDVRKAAPVSQGRCGTEQVFGVRFVPDGTHSKLVTHGVKNVMFHQVEGAAITSRKGVFGRTAVIQSVLSCCFVGKDKFVTGAFGGQLYLWDVGTRTIVKQAAAHKCPVSAVAFDSASNTVYSGAKDGSVGSWDAKSLESKGAAVRVPSPGPEPRVRALHAANGRVALGTATGSIFVMDASTRALDLVVQGHFGGELWGLATHPSLPRAVSVGDDGVVNVWDMELHTVENSKFGLGAARCAAFDPSGSRIAVGTESGHVVIMGAQDLNTLYTTKVAGTGITDIKFSPDGTRVAVGSHDRDVVVLDDHLRVQGSLKGHHDTITHFDWSADGKWIQTNSAGYELLFWNTETLAQHTSASSLRDVQWATWSCVLGFPVVGIFEPAADGTDVNAVSRNRRGNLLATGDDFGKVNLFRFPCVTKGARHHRMTLHSAHVTNVSFTADDQYVVSAGGRDCAVVLWRVHGAGSAPAPIAAPAKPAAAKPAAASAAPAPAKPAAYANAAPSSGAPTTIVEFLARAGVDQKYAQVFEDEEVGMDSMALLTVEDLEKMRIPLGPRRKIADAISKLPR